VVSFRSRVSFALLVLLASSRGYCAEASDPKAVAVEFYSALGKGDTKAAKALSIAGPREEKWIEANAAMNAGFKHVYAAALAKFGPEGAKRFAEKSPAEYSADLAEKAPVRQAGDEAGIIVNEKTGAAIVLSRKDGQWKMDWIKGMKDKDLQPQTALYTRMADALGAVAEGIGSGKYPSASDAERDLKARFLTAATSQPATPPT
jgi:hypothetical protein